MYASFVEDAIQLVVHEVDITIDPDSDKIGVWGMGMNKLYPQASDVDDYEGE